MHVAVVAYYAFLVERIAAAAAVEIHLRLLGFPSLMPF